MPQPVARATYAFRKLVFSDASSLLSNVCSPCTMILPIPKGFVGPLGYSYSYTSGAVTLEPRLTVGQWLEKGMRQQNLITLRQGAVQLSRTASTFTCDNYHRRCLPFYPPQLSRYKSLGSIGGWTKSTRSKKKLFIGVLINQFIASIGPHEEIRRNVGLI